MGKIKLSICCGTTCYLLGNVELLSLQEKLMEEFGDRIEIEGSPCLGLCTNDQLRPPFALLDKRIISQANMEKILYETRIIIGEM